LLFASSEFSSPMFHDQKRKVYQHALEFAGWSQILIDSVTKKTSTPDQFERAGDSIALNTAKGDAQLGCRVAEEILECAERVAEKGDQD
jgi:hypothetical protein